MKKRVRVRVSICLCVCVCVRGWVGGWTTPTKNSDPQPPPCPQMAQQLKALIEPPLLLLPVPPICLRTKRKGRGSVMDSLLR